MIVGNIKNLLTTAGIDVWVKNEFASGGVGELSAFDAWPEIWLQNESDIDKAKALISKAHQNANKPDWFCQNCKEANSATFELCWNCNQEAEQ